MARTHGRNGAHRADVADPLFAAGARASRHKSPQRRGGRRCFLARTRLRIHVCAIAYFRTANRHRHKKTKSDYVFVGFLGFMRDLPHRVFYSALHFYANIHPSECVYLYRFLHS